MVIPANPALLLDPTQLKEMKRELRREGLRLQWPLIVILVILIIFSIYIFLLEINSGFRVQYLAQAFLGIVFILQGYSTYRNKDYFRRVNILHTGNAREGFLKWGPLALILSGMMFMVMGLTSFTLKSI